MNTISIHQNTEFLIVSKNRLNTEAGRIGLHSQNLLLQLCCLEFVFKSRGRQVLHHNGSLSELLPHRLFEQIQQLKDKIGKSDSLITPTPTL